MHKFKRICKYVFVLLITVALVSQMLLFNDNVKTVLSRVYSLEAKYTLSEQASPCGRLRITVSNPSDSLYVLQNGEKSAVLNKKELEIEVGDNSVIEVDGTDLPVKTIIRIADISKNLDGYYEKSAEIDKNIVILGRFFVK